MRVAAIRKPMSGQVGVIGINSSKKAITIVAGLFGKVGAERCLRRQLYHWCAWCSLRLRVAAAFFADADRSSFVREADAWPPLRPPFSEEAWLSV